MTVYDDLVKRRKFVVSEAKALERAARDAHRRAQEATRAACGPFNRAYGHSDRSAALAEISDEDLRHRNADLEANRTHALAFVKDSVFKDERKSPVSAER